MRRFAFAVCVVVPFMALAQEDTLPPPSPPPPPPPVEAMPRDVPPPPDTPPADPYAPPPEPAPAPRRRDHSREYGRQPPEPEPNWRVERKGFHLGLGLGGFAYPVGNGGGSVDAVGFVALLPSVAWSWGWVEAHVAASALGYFQAGQNAFFGALDPQLRVNFAPWYSLGFGPYVGFAATPHVSFVLGTSISPAIVHLGARGQHEIALWWASPTIFSHNQTGVTLLLLSYSYTFF